MKPNEKDIMVELGLEIRRRREELGLTQQDLGERSGIGPNYIGNIENGRRDPGTLALLKIADALECHVGQLFGDRSGIASAAAFDGAEMIDRLDPVPRRHVLGILKALQGQED